MTDDRAPRWWSWADIVRNRGRLGIPNFQRGAVWDAGNRVALLESIYEQSPCGSFVLWSPPANGDLMRHGVPLHSFEPGISPMWLVDGQQRTRTMLETFRQLLKAPTAEGWSLVRRDDLDSLLSLYQLPQNGAAGDDQEGEDTFWGVVLPAMRVFDREGRRHFGGYGESQRVLRGSMFRRISPQARIMVDSKGKEKPVPPAVKGGVPLAALVAPTGVFNESNLRQEAKKALDSFDTPDPDFSRLNQLVPWGPQFVTGYCYERPAGEDKGLSPIRWRDIHNRTNKEVIERVKQLAGLLTPKWCPVFKRFADMLVGNRFAVGWLPPSDVSAAIDAYIRINRAGIRVRPEERALALLSRAHPGLLDDLAEFSRLRGDSTPEDRHSLLTHESDRHLGFAIWMSTVTRYSTLALLGNMGLRWLGCSAIDKETFSYRLDRVGPKETDTGKKPWARDYAAPGDLVKECSARVSRALTLVDSVLSEELLLDHRMARPTTRALGPLIDLFYRLPDSAIGQLQDDQPFRTRLALLIRWTLLAPYIDQPGLERLIIDVHGVGEPVVPDVKVPVWGPDTQACIGKLNCALDRYQTRLEKLWSGQRHNTGGSPAAVEGLTLAAKLNALALDAFQGAVSEARSLQHPAVGWLYALERRAGAREFLWQAQYAGYKGDKRTGIPPGTERCEEPLKGAVGEGARHLYPEKQHLVPFVIARQIVDKGGTRATASPANAIGNLTWLSQRQNTLNGLADRWTVMDPQNDHGNLKARGMLAPAQAEAVSRTALDLYHKLQAVILSDGCLKDQVMAGTLFEAFCKARADWMVGQMHNWLEEQPTRAHRSL